jgi:hypothetical protein
MAPWRRLHLIGTFVGGTIIAENANEESRVVIGRTGRDHCGRNARAPGEISPEGAGPRGFDLAKERSAWQR